MTNQQTGVELPCYRSHKFVWALQIKKLEFTDRWMITPEEPGYAPFSVTADYICKHDPQVGGYWVIYKDGYQSWSPAAAFEEGYTRL